MWLSAPWSSWRITSEWIDHDPCHRRWRDEMLARPRGKYIGDIEMGLQIKPALQHPPSPAHSVQLAPYFKGLLLNKFFLLYCPLFAP